MSDKEIFRGDRSEVAEMVTRYAERFEAAGYAFRGMDSSRKSIEPYVLTVWTKGDWLIRIKQFRTWCEVAAFDGEGYLCPLHEAL